MDVRPARVRDGEAIGSVVRRSLKASYALSPQVIDGIVDEYDGEAMEDRLGDGRVADDGHVYLVAETEDGVVGFAQGRLADDGVGEIVWVHVAPAGRGQGAGTGLFEHLRGELEERGASHVRALVLGDNQEGDAFFERFDLRRLAQTDVEHAGVSITAHVYADDEAAIDDDSMTRVGDAVEDAEAADVGDPGDVDVPDGVTADGRDVHVDDDEPIPGNEAPFFRTFGDEGREEHYGYYCSNCGSTATAMGELERIECGNCGNVHRADEWDAAYL